MDIVITEFQNRKKSNGKVVHTTWENLVDRLTHPVITDETLDEYRAMTNEERTEVKDVGGYVAGEFIDGKRSKEKLKSRYILTIDADDATDHDVDDYSSMEDYLFFVHTTHTSTSEKPRLRWLFPLTRPVTSEEYRILIGVAKSWVGADTIDETTDQPERLMFWPSVSCDVDYYYWSGGCVVLDPDYILDDIDPEDIEQAVNHSSKSSLSFDFSDIDDLIPEGSRNHAVFRYASKLREAGLDNDILLDSVELFNEKYCSPPLPSFEIRTIVGSVCKFKKGEKVPFNMMDSDGAFGDLGTVKKKSKNVFGEECMSDLWEEDVKDQEFIVKDLIPTGVGGIIAPPKFGKSWLCLDLCLAVSTGTPFLGFETIPNEVLYLALEDGKVRLNRRSRIVAGDDRKDMKKKFHYDLKAPTLDDGFLKILDETLKTYPGIKLVVIDTLQKIRGEAKKGESVYQYDYREISDLHNFAIDHDIAIVLVHHTKKGIDDSDPLSNASGSNGVSGSLDFSLNLFKKNRKDRTTKMAVIGRDTEEYTYVLQFDKSTCRWINLGKEQEVRLDETEESYESDPLVKTIRYYIGKKADEIPDDDLFTEEVVWEVTAKQLYDAMENFCGETEYTSSVSVGVKLPKIAPALEARDGIVYEKGRDSDKRFHRFVAQRF